MKTASQPARQPRAHVRSSNSQGDPAPEQRARRLAETVLLSASVLLIAALGFAVQTILSPFVITGAIIYLLYPLRESPVPRRLLLLAVLLFTLWFLDAILGLLVPFLLAFLLAYLLDPLVTVLEERRLPRWLSALIAVLLLIGLVVGSLLFLLPAAAGQFQGIINGLSAMATDVANLLNSGAVFDLLARYGIPVDTVKETITRELSPRLESLLKTLVEGAFSFVTSLSAVVMQLLNAIIVPFLVFYLLKDFRVINHRFLMIVPRSRRERIAEIAAKVDLLLGKYLRGAIVVAAIQGTIAAFGLWAIGVDYPLVLGILHGLLDFVPYVGFFTSLVIACVVAFFGQGAVWTKVLWVVALYATQKLVEDTVFVPKIIGNQVGLHPVLLILSLLIFGHFLGFVGLVIAVPATALLIAGVKEWEAVRRGRRQSNAA